MMLIRDQLLHFAEHGWVLEEDIIAPDQVEQYKCGLEKKSDISDPSYKDTEDIKNVAAMVNYDQIFRDWIMIPQVLDANCQLLSCEIKYECCHAMIKTPHPG